MDERQLPIRCPFCGHPNPREVASYGSFRDRAWDVKLGVFQCLSCSTVFLLSMPGHSEYLPHTEQDMRDHGY